MNLRSFRVESIRSNLGCEIVCDCNDPGSLKSMIETRPQNFWIGHGDHALEALGKLIEALQWNLHGCPPSLRIDGATTLVIRRA